jgi:uncharacterized membrane protein
MILGLLIHTIVAMIWVGGMAFAHFMLRPAVGPLDPPVRLALWDRVFARFFPTVWAVILLLLASGYGMVFVALGGFAHIGLHIHLMQATGIVMMLAFAHLYFVPWRRFHRAVAAGDFPAAAAQLGSIRKIVTFNLALGIVTVALGSTGRYWG